jgi:uncharacterized iron-regulated membrane protein
MHPTLRNRLLQVHVYAGLTAGLVLVIIAIAGALMVFRPQLDPVVNPELFAVQTAETRVALDVLATNAHVAYPGSSFNFVRFWADPKLPAMIRCANSDQIYLDPWTGRVLGMQNRYRGFFGRSEDIHRFLGMGNSVGKQITGAAVLLFILMILTGFVVWLPPAWRAVRGALTFNSRLTGRARLLNWHRVVGAWVGVIVLVSAISGLPHAYDWYEHGVYRIVGSDIPEIPAIEEQPGMKPLPMEELWRRTRELMPDYHSAQINFPRKGKATEIWVVETGSPHPHARGYLHLDTYSGAVVKFEPWARSSAGNRLYYWPGQVILFLAVLGIPVLAVTGAWSYFRRTRRTSAAR